MHQSLTAQHILDEIELELIQGAWLRDDVGKGVLEARQFQNKVRSEFQNNTAKPLDVSRLAARQFQINDMVLTLLQVITGQLQALRLDLQRALAYSRFALHAPAEQQSPSAGSTAAPFASTSNRPGQTFADRLDALIAQSEEAQRALEPAMRADALKIERVVRPVSVPLAGGLVTKVRAALHSLTLFYVDRLAERQTAVNRLYGDWLLRLVQQHRQQQETIALLQKQVGQLQRQLAELQRE